MSEAKHLVAPKGSRKDRKRVGRGAGSGWGCTSGRGNNGAKSRSGYKRTPGFEGGQMPFIRRIPKFGFTNARFKKDFDILNVSDLEKIGVSEITREVLFDKGYLSSRSRLVKLLGIGDISSAVNITVDGASKSAVEKVEKAGGKVTIIPEKKWTRDRSKAGKADK